MEFPQLQSIDHNCTNESRPSVCNNYSSGDEIWRQENYLDTEPYSPDYYLFTQPEVKIPLLVLYSIVFFFAFFGNLLVVLVMTLHRRMTSYTNFFLTNLAVADLCVSIFCIYQNFALYVIKDWYLGEFLCRMYHFVNTLSCTASVIILVAVSGERYLAIVEPLKAKVILTKRKMMITMAFVWIFSAAYSCPRFVYFQVATFPAAIAGQVESICYLRRELFDSRVWDITSLLLLYLLPLIFLTFLYARIAQTLYKSSRLLAEAANGEYGTFTSATSMMCCRPTLEAARVSQHPSYTESSSGQELEDESRTSYHHDHPKRTRGSLKSVLSTYISLGSFKEDKNGIKNTIVSQELIPLSTRDSNLCYHSHLNINNHHSHHNNDTELRSPGLDDGHEIHPRKRYVSRHPRTQRPIVLRPSPMVLKARKKVVQMLIMVVVCFALCSLPFHVRKMFQYFLPVYKNNAPYAYLLTPFTSLFMYSHSAVNPLLYTAMSRRFRASLRDLFSCRLLQGGRRGRHQPRPVIIRVDAPGRVTTQAL